MSLTIGTPRIAEQRRSWRLSDLVTYMRRGDQFVYIHGDGSVSRAQTFLRRFRGGAVFIATRGDWELRIDNPQYAMVQPVFPVMRNGQERYHHGD